MKIDIDGDTITDIVVQDLKGYHEIMLNNPEEDGICEAIEKVLYHYMNMPDYANWYNDVYGPKGKEVIDE
jgi:hypothetical protein